MKQKKVKKSKKDKKTAVPSGKKEQMLMICIAVLIVLAMIVAVYGIWSVTGLGSQIGEKAEDPLMIEELIAGSYKAEIKEEDGEYVIHLAVGEDFDYQNVILNIVLPSGASVSQETNCLIGELADRPVLNLGKANPVLVIQNGEDSRTYHIQLELK